MAARITGATKEIWLGMLREGGRWSSTEVKETFGLSDLADARSFLNSMAAAESVKRFVPRAGDPITFGITHQCRVPMGVTLEELAQIGVLKGAA